MVWSWPDTALPVISTIFGQPNLDGIEHRATALDRVPPRHDDLLFIRA